MIRGSRGRVGGRREFIDQRLFQQGQVFVLLHTAELRFHVPERRRTPAQRLIACAPSPRRAPRAPRARPPQRGRRAPAPRGETRRTCARASVAVCTTPGSASRPSRIPASATTSACNACNASSTARRPSGIRAWIMASVTGVVTVPSSSGIVSCTVGDPARCWLFGVTA